MNNVLVWAKANVFIIVFTVVMIAALVTLPLLSGGMNAKVRQEVQKRAARFGDFSQIERTTYHMPGDPEPRTGVINRELIEQFKQRVESARGDADRVFETALERNRQGRTVLMPELFPAPPAGLREILPERFHERLVRAYDDLLAEIGVGGPPDPETVRVEVQLRREQIIGQILARDAGDDLTEEERQHLREQLAELRMLQYHDAAELLTFYLSREALRIPRWDQQNIPNLAELFERQWRYWIHSDVLRGLAAANRNDSSLLSAPVKRVVRFDFIGAPAATATGGPTGGGIGGMGGEGGGPVGGGGAAVGGGGAAVGGGGIEGGGYGGTPPGSGDPDPDVPPGPVIINRTAEVPVDFAASFTGRRTNPLYDVRYVELELVVDTARVPEIFDALAQQNFMTVIGLRMGPADPYEDARDGYYYGLEPVSRLTLQIETIWLRSWTAQYMPATTRAALGITSAAEPPGY